MAEKIVKVGLVGFGTVGAGVAKLLLEQNEQIASRCGVRLKLACVVDKDLESKRCVELPAGLLTDDLNKFLEDDRIEIGVELVGGTSIAKDIQIAMLKAGKDVVTANKALLAEYGSELLRVARENNRCIAFEASCAGGIPIVSGIRSDLAANDIIDIFGILNGTCNYILSNMTSKGENFADALAQAQEKGFAEANPTLDISGGDSAHKLAILASIAFGCEIAMEDIFIEGIEAVSQDDIRYGGEMGYTLKLLAIGQREKDGKISLRVHPSFIAKDNPLARVAGSFNAVSVIGSAVGQVMYIGRGAGMMPTASAVVADIIDVGLGNSARTFENMNLAGREETKKMIKDIDNFSCRFYMRVMAKDQPGVVASYGKVLGDHDISISGALQHEGCGPDNTVPVVITTHLTSQKNVAAALEDIKKLDIISGEPICIRIVDIPEDSD